MPTLARRHHGECGIADQRDEKPVRAATVRDLRMARGVGVADIGSGTTHAAVLPSTISAPTSSAETSSRTARG